VYSRKIRGAAKKAMIVMKRRPTMASVTTTSVDSSSSRSLKPVNSGTNVADTTPPSSTS
jgi:hypothetical protein